MITCKNIFVLSKQILKLKSKSKVKLMLRLILKIMLMLRLILKIRVEVEDKVDVRKPDRWFFSKNRRDGTRAR